MTWILFSLRPLCAQWLNKKMKNKANFAKGEMSVCSLLTSEYVDFMQFVAEKNKANFVSPGYYPGLMEMVKTGKVSIILGKK